MNVATGCAAARRLGLTGLWLTGLWLTGLGLTACSGTAGETDAGPLTRSDAGLFDAGPPVIVYRQFTLRTNGWPAGARVLGAAVLDNALFVASDQGVLAMPVTQTRWVPVTTPLTGDLKPTSLQRVDQRLVLTAAGATTGGLFVKPFDGDWAASSSPPNPTWAVVKKSNEYLLATKGGLYASAALSGPWARRSAASATLFAGEISRFVAAPAQQKIFAAGASGPLQESADLGVTWAASALRGTVGALAASGAVVLASTSLDGQQRSDNYGNTFRDAGTPVPDGVLVYSAEGSKFWAGGNGGLKVSVDDGVTFTDASDGLPGGASVRALFFAGTYAIVDTAEGPYLNQPE